MARIIFAPFARRLPSGPNPKDYPIWLEVIRAMEADGHEVVQCGDDEDQRLAQHFIGNIKPDEMAKVIASHDIVLCVDTWLQHAAATLCPEVKRVVVWRCTDPDVFGHAGNINVSHHEPKRAPNQFAKAEEWGKAGDYPYPPSNMVVMAVRGALQPT